MTPSNPLSNHPPRYANTLSASGNNDSTGAYSYGMMMTAAAMGHDKDMFLTMAVPVLETILTVSKRLTD